VTEIICLIGGIAVGAIFASVLMHFRAQSLVHEKVREVEGRAQSAESAVIELRNAVNKAEAQLEAVRKELTQERDARVESEAFLKQCQIDIAKQEAMLEEAKQRLTDTFKALASDALKTNNQAFMELSRQSLETVLADTKGEMGKHKEAINGLLSPIRTLMESYEKNLHDLEKRREGAYGSLETLIKTLTGAQKTLETKTDNLVQALRAPQVRGKWGEITLQRVVELAGLSEYCDFDLQQTVTGEEGRIRPDLIVRLPGDRSIIVDAKVPLDAYMDAMQTEDTDLRAQKLTAHAAAVRSHMTALSGKSYWSQFKSAPEYVVLFLPGESFFSAALEGDRTLIEEGIQKRVILATPTTLIMALLTVAHSWQQQQLAENARHIAEAGQALYERLGTFAQHLDGIRDGLKTASKAYDRAVGSWESRVMPGARSLKELGAAKSDADFPDLKLSEPPVRRLAQPDSPQPAPDAPKAE
jgi:DNA recombination protein RmuC